VKVLLKLDEPTLTELLGAQDSGELRGIPGGSQIRRHEGVRPCGIQSQAPLARGTIFEFFGVGVGTILAEYR
jgi:hypothetical protein